MTRRSGRAWAQWALLAFIGVGSLLAGIQNLAGKASPGAATGDQVATWESRYRALKERLPFQRGFVGYVSDADTANITFEAEYVVAQYAMAPIIVVRGADQEWNIGNFNRGTLGSWSRANPDSFEITHIRGPLYLLHRLSP